MKRFVVAMAMFAALPVFAQGPGGPMEHGPMRPFGMLQPVTNAPYSATFTDTSTEKLQDGTVLTHTTTRVTSRDSLGRTRQEITRTGGPDGKAHTETVILDPVAHTITRLNAEKKTAMVHALPQGGQHGFGHRGPDAPPPSPDQVAATSPEGPRGHREDKNVTVADLGSKTISGVLATGTKRTRTIPANAMGNATAIVSTHEAWISPDLKIELSRTDVDPFHGTDDMAVSGLTKAEPAAALFQVPQGYTVEQAPQRAGFRRGRPDAPPPGI
jgi:hypothetical protein